jgi:hypothetical protein
MITVDSTVIACFADLRFASVAQKLAAFIGVRMGLS